MRTSALEFLACPSCHSNLVADTDPPAPDGHIMSGVLVCRCGNRYPIRRGVPRLAGGSSESENREPDSAALLPSPFGSRWAMLENLSTRYEQQFLDWVAPLNPRDFTNRVVLQAGCRAGGHTPLIARYGARAVIALEPSPDVELAFSSTRHLSNAHVVQGKLSQPPLARVFDIAISIGTIGHLVDPLAGFRATADRVVKNGRIAIWVSSYEANKLLVHCVDPVRRKVTTKLPRQLVYWASLGPAVALKATLQLCRLRTIAKLFPRGAYLHYISWYPLRKVHHLVFDQLTSPVSHYLREEEIRSWFESPDLDQVKITFHKQTSWQASAVVVGHSETDTKSAEPAHSMPA